MMVDLGDIIKIRIGHDNGGFGADWFLESVSIKNDKNEKSFDFICNQWFSDSKSGISFYFIFIIFFYIKFYIIFSRKFLL